MWAKSRSRGEAVGLIRKSARALSVTGKGHTGERVLWRDQEAPGSVIQSELELMSSTRSKFLPKPAHDCSRTGVSARGSGRQDGVVTALISASPRELPVVRRIGFCPAGNSFCVARPLDLD
jgi:hypothetical protein